MIPWWGKRKEESYALRGKLLAEVSPRHLAASSDTDRVKDSNGTLSLGKLKMIVSFWQLNGLVPNLDE